MERFVRAARLEDVQAAGCVVVNLQGEGIALFAHDRAVYAIDNRCPHMGFPLHRGTLKDGILTCHWHHARFDLASGGTFDQFADDVRAFPTIVREGEVWVDLAPRGDPRTHQLGRLRDGLERDIPLVVGKAVVFLLETGEDPAEPFRMGLKFGTRYRASGWGPGLTMHTALMNMLGDLDPGDRPRALFHGLSAVARDTAGEPARFIVGPLPTSTTDVEILKRWFRQFVEVRDEEGAERCIVSALKGGATSAQLSDLMFAAATDHRYITTGHVLDFTNKAFEALDRAGWDYAEQALTSLARGYARADRMEESNSWRHPVDLIAILHDAFEALPRAIEKGSGAPAGWSGEEALIEIMFGEDPRAIADALLTAVAEGASSSGLASAVAHAAALRIARFHTSNEFSDWDTALHTLSFAHAVHKGLERAPSPELTRGVFDAAMSVYLDRFLNVPATRLPSPDDRVDEPNDILKELPTLLDRQQQVNRAGDAVARYLNSGGDPNRLVSTIGGLLLREDRDFHTIQTAEACITEFRRSRATEAGVHLMVAAARYLAAHSPTVRAQGQTYQIAVRLFRGETLYEE
jgi:nitrite reductase/ring-hydroxylating ferredoxin subunit